MRTFVCGDIHGNYKGLIQCFERSNFDMERDKLILLGDTCDGKPDTFEVVQHLLKVKNLINIRGNHDKWFIDYIMYDKKPSIWTIQGGEATLRSYNNNVPDTHKSFFLSSIYYYIDNKNNIFIHGGFDKNIKDIKEYAGTDKGKHNILWDRDLYYYMKRKHNNKSYKSYTVYNKIFIGHTQTYNKKVNNYCNLWNIDTGSGWDGVLTFMDIDNNKCYYSDNSFLLYPDTVTYSAYFIR